MVWVIVFGVGIWLFDELVNGLDVEVVVWFEVLVVWYWVGGGVVVIVMY